MRTKGRIALDLLDQVRSEGMPGRLVVADAGYGVSGPFRDGLAERGCSTSSASRRDGGLPGRAEVGRPGPGQPAGGAARRPARSWPRTRLGR